MKKIVFYIMLTLFIPLSANSLVGVTHTESEDAINFVKNERYQQQQLYDYVRLLKEHYVLSKALVWTSNKIAEAIDIQFTMMTLMVLLENPNEN